MDKYVQALELDAGQLFDYNGKLYVCLEIECDPTDVIVNVKVQKVGRFQRGTSTPKSAFIGPLIVGNLQPENFNPYGRVRLLME